MVNFHDGKRLNSQESWGTPCLTLVLVPLFTNWNRVNGKMAPRPSELPRKKPLSYSYI